MFTIPVNWTRFKRWRTSVLIFLSVLGPGIITANVDNDAGGIYTYSVAGARYGYSLLWTLIPITVALIVVQEMVARMGVVTGKGLADLIREEYGFRTTFILMVVLLLTNLGKYRFGIRRPCFGDVGISCQPVYFRPAWSRAGLAPRGAGNLPGR